MTGWSDWINQDQLSQQSAQQSVKSSKSNYFKTNDVEPLPSNMQMKNLGGLGKAVCSSDYFAAIECRTAVGHTNSKNTGQDVECSLERGLICKGQCFDFEIRVYCECGDSGKVSTTPKTFATTTQKSVIPVIPVVVVPTQPAAYIKICDPKVPNVEHPFSCTKFLQCIMSQNGSYVYTEKTCGDTMMFNPKAMVCDWPASVKAVKPKCGTAPEEPQRMITTQRCPPGYTWSECAIPCSRSCNYYKQQLNLAGNCSMSSNDCIAGCMPSGSALTCEYPKLWRDWQSCVDLQTCTCMGPNNEIMKVRKYHFV